MGRKKTTTVYLTDSEMDRINEYFHKTYPFIHRENTLYEVVGLCGIWEVKVNENSIDEVRALMEPCEIRGFEL